MEEVTKDIEGAIENTTQYAIKQFIGYLNSMAKVYGQRIIDTNSINYRRNKEIADIKSEYIYALKTIDLIYKEQYGQILLKIDNLKKRKHKIQKIQKKLKVESNSKILEENERIIEKCNEELTKCINNMIKEKSLQELLREERFHNAKDTYLKVVDKMEPFSKFFGWFKNKINGKKRFRDEITIPFQNGVNNIRIEKIPKLSKKVKKETVEFLEGINKELQKKIINYEFKGIKSIKGIKQFRKSGKFKAVNIGECA